jgi:hypothetical protein
MVYSDEREAALDRFRQILKFDDGQFVFNANGIGPDSGDRLNLKDISVRLVDEEGALIRQLSFRVPVYESDENQSNSVFVLSLPERELYEKKLDRISDGLVWSDSTGDALCVTIVFSVPGGYRAVDATYIELRQP